MALDHRRLPGYSRLICSCLILSLLVGGFYDLGFASILRTDLTIYDIQYTLDPSGDSPYIGQEVSLTGVVTGSFYYGYFIADAPGAWHAVFVYTRKNAPRIGDMVQVTGTVEEYFGFTEISDVTGFQVLSSGNDIAPLTVNTGSAGQEMYESALVQVENVTVTSLEDFGEWIANDSTGGVRCDDVNDYMYFPKVGETLDSLTGVLYYSYGDYKIEPRQTSDIEGDVIPHYALRGDIVTMNDARQVLQDAYLEVQGDLIVGLHASAPPGVSVIHTGGLIFPGLIDAHNHPAYNTLDSIPFDQFFSERYEWQEAPLYDDFKDQYNDVLDFGGAGVQRDNLYKLAEVRALTSGTTMIQGINVEGHDYDGFARQGIGVNNAERFPSRIYSKVFPLNNDATYWHEKSGEYWDRFVIHLSEGVNQAALDEFYAWGDMGMLDARTTIIHGIPYGGVEWTLMAAVDANLIWSPESNWKLYGTTADIPGALAAGVNVALAPDWTESGSLHLLDEMKIANSINQSRWHGVISPLQLAEFITRNAALALGIEERVGQIAVGYMADLMIIPGDPQSPYEALLAAQPVDVWLTVVNGRPMYGTPALMGQFTFLESLEDITIGGHPRKLALRIESHAIPEADKPFSEVLSNLETAYGFSDPKVCAFLGLERALSANLFLPLITR